MKRVFNISLVIVTFLSLAVSIAYVYYRTIGKDSLPGAITSTYSTLVVDPYTGEELSAIESNYYANKNGQGYEVVELLFNAYSGISQDAIYSRGFQLVDNGKDDPKLYYYDRYDGVSFETGHEYSWGDKMLISIDGKPYAVALDGTYTTSETSFDGLKLHGMYFETFKGGPVEILFHGYRGSAFRDMSSGIERAKAVGRNALLVEQRTCGQSEGKVISFGINEPNICFN